MSRSACLFSVDTPPVRADMPIGLLGGSFNPAHAGHRQISVIARRRLGLSAVWWIVSPGNPLKRHDDLVPLTGRIRRAREVAAAPWIEVTAFEAALGSAYTIDTVAWLRRRYPHARFVWLMGADNLAQMHRWRRWRDIAQSMPMAVVDRPGWHLRALSSPAARAFAEARVPEAEARRITGARAPAWTFLTGPLSPLSSSALRRRQRG